MYERPDSDPLTHQLPPGMSIVEHSVVVSDNPVLSHAQKLVNKRRDDSTLLLRIALTVRVCLGCTGGLATAGVAFALDRSHFGWVSLVGVVSFVVLLWTALIAAIWLPD